MSPRIAAILLLASLAACTSDPVNHVIVDVYRYIDQDDCYVPCEVDGAVEAGFAEPPGTMCEDGQACRFEAGRDRVRVVVDYGPVTFATGESIPSAKLQTLVNGVALGEPAELQARRSDEDRGFAATDFRVPVASAGSLRFVAEVGDGFGDESRPFDLVGPTLSADFSDCGPCDADEPCELPEGGGTTRLELDVPRGLPDAKVQVINTLDGVEQQGAVSFDVPVSNTDPLRVDVQIPTDPGRRWGLRLKSGEFVGTSCQEVRLVPRAPVTLAAGADEDAALGANNGTFPKRIAFEPNPACRTVGLASTSSQVMTRHDAKFTTSVGVLDDSGMSLDVPFEEGDDELVEAVAQLELPASVVPQSKITLSVEVEDFGKVERVWHFEDLPIGGAELFVPGAPLRLTPTGTPSVLVTGFLRAPASLRPGNAPADFDAPRFSPGTSVSLVVDVLETYDEELECGTPVPVENLLCDRDGALSGPTGPQGGCVLTPDRLTVGEDGRFLVTLTPGQCFAGRVNLSVWAPLVAVDPLVCMGEQMPAPGATLEPLDEVIVEFRAPEPEPDPEPEP